MSETFYQKLWAEHGVDLKSLGWSSVAAQLKRFNILRERYPGNGTVLDVGCGFGDFSICFASESYLGIDIIPGFIEEARRKYPTKRFVVENIFDHEGQADYVFANGVLAFQEQPIKIIQKMWDITNLTLGFTWLNATVHDIDLAIKICQAEYYEIRHDYLPNDTTVFMHRGSQ